MCQKLEILKKSTIQKAQYISQQKLITWLLNLMNLMNLNTF